MNEIMIIYFCIILGGNGSNGEEQCYEMSLLPDYTEQDAKKDVRDSYGASNVKFISEAEYNERFNNVDKK